MQMYIVNSGFINEFINISSNNSEKTLPEIAAGNSCTPESLFDSCLVLNHYDYKLIID